MIRSLGHGNDLASPHSDHCMPDNSGAWATSLTDLPTVSRGSSGSGMVRSASVPPETAAYPAQPWDVPPFRPLMWGTGPPAQSLQAAQQAGVPNEEDSREGFLEPGIVMAPQKRDTPEAMMVADTDPTFLPATHSGSWDPAASHMRRAGAPATRHVGSDGRYTGRGVWPQAAPKRRIVATLPSDAMQRRLDALSAERQRLHQKSLKAL